MNSVASGIRVRDESQLESPLRQAVITALIVASAYALFSALLAAYAAREIGALRADLDKIGQRVKAADEALVAQRKDVQAVEVRVAKQRLLLLARISDYSKELLFWRNAVAKLMLAKGGDLKTANDVAEAVTNALQTHGTKALANDYEAVRVAASWLAESEKGGGAGKSEAGKTGSSGHEN